MTADRSKEIPVRFPLTMFALSLVAAAGAYACQQPPTVANGDRLALVATTITVPATTSSTVSTTTTVAPSTTTTTTIPAGDWRCPQWLGLALQVGFPADELVTVDRLIHRESTCRPEAFNRTDPNGGSRGLLQVNGIWCNWYLQSLHILTGCDELFDPAVNLRAGLAIRLRQGGYAAWGL